MSLISVYGKICESTFCAEIPLTLGDLASKYSSKTQKMFTEWPCTAPTGPEDILPKAGIPLDEIKEIIFSHTHFDHIGDISAFPPSAKLVFGNYSNREKVEDLEKLAASLQVSPDVLRDRSVHHLSDKQWHQVGSIRGFDYFGDGSVWAVDLPGHMEGSIGLLIATQNVEKPHWYLLAGDAAHHISLIAYKSPAEIGVYKAKESRLSAYYESEPEKLQCMEEDIGRLKQCLWQVQLI